MRTKIIKTSCVDTLSRGSLWQPGQQRKHRSAEGMYCTCSRLTPSPRQPVRVSRGCRAARGPVHLKALPGPPLMSAVTHRPSTCPDFKAPHRPPPASFLQDLQLLASSPLLDPSPRLSDVVRLGVHTSEAASYSKRQHLRVFWEFNQVRKVVSAWCTPGFKHGPQVRKSLCAWVCACVGVREWVCVVGERTN